MSSYGEAKAYFLWELLKKEFGEKAVVSAMPDNGVLRITVHWTETVFLGTGFSDLRMRVDFDLNSPNISQEQMEHLVHKVHVDHVEWERERILNQEF